jgi:hypothetical protein
VDDAGKSFLSGCALAATALVVACKDSASGPTRARPAAIGIRPVLRSDAAAINDRLAQSFGLAFDHVRIVIARPPADTVKDTTVVFTSDQESMTLDLDVQVRRNAETFDVSVDYLHDATLLFRGQGTATAHDVDEPAPDDAPIDVAYVGPGANVTRLVVSTDAASIIGTATSTMTVSAFDGAGAPVANVPLLWSTSDATLASVSTAGVVQGTNKRGQAKIRAMTPTSIFGEATVDLAPSPTTLVLVSGGDQSGKAGDALPDPAQVRVVADDGLGVAGVIVNFAAPLGGAVGDVATTSDASGLVSSALTLGPAAGAQEFVATSGGLRLSIGESATAADAAVAVALSGDAQSDTVNRQLPAPFVVRVTDRFGNGVPGVHIAWSRVGAGQLGGIETTTDAFGQIGTAYTLGTSIGEERVFATVPGIDAPVVFTAHALSDVPAVIAFRSAPTASIPAATPIDPSVQLELRDRYGNLTTATNTVSIALGVNPGGATLSGTLSQAAVSGVATLTDLKINKVGAGYTLVASSSGVPATTSQPFGVKPGLPATLVVVSGDLQNARVDEALPSALSVRVLDGGGNVVPGMAVTFSTPFGGGAIDGAAQTTDANGVATSGRVQLGPTPTTNEFVATAGGVTSPLLTATATWEPALAAGTWGACAVIAGSSLQCWGDNSLREFGVSNATLGLPGATVPTPTAVFPGVIVSRIGNSTGQGFCGLMSSGWQCWGRDIGAMTGGSSGANSRAPGPIDGGVNFGEANFGRTTGCGVSVDHVGYCWGLNQQGEVGSASVAIGSTATIATAVDGGSQFATIIPGWTNTCGLTLDGTAYCWGTNTSGQLGTGSTDADKHLSPERVKTNEKFTQLSVGPSHACGVTRAHALLCWGRNETGQLGDGTTVSRGTPMPVAGSLKFSHVEAGDYILSSPDPATLSALGVVTPGIQAGASHTCALTDEGTPYCWGWNGAGQLGDGTRTDRYTPTRVNGGLALTSLSLGDYFSCGMRGNAVWCWGANEVGEAGDGSTGNLRLDPVSVHVTP